jgi:parallel beta-helix repeat protein
LDGAGAGRTAASGHPQHAAVRARWTLRGLLASRVGRVATAAAGGLLLLVPFGLSGPAAQAATASRESAGLTVDSVALPTKATKTIDIVKAYKATPGNDSDDDGEAFRKAIQAAGTNTEIFVPKGNYVFKKPNVVLKSGVSIRGESGAVIITKFTSSSDNQGSSIFSASAGTKDITISGLKLTSSGGKALNYPLWLGSSSGSNVSRIAIRDMQIDKFYKMAISVRNGDNVTIEKNTIKDALATGGGGEGYGIMIGYSKSANNRVADNTIQGPKIRHGILLQYSAHNNLVEKNLVTQTVYDAFDLHGEEEYANEFRGNTARDCGEGGFGVGNTGADHANAGPGNWIHDNTVTGCKWGIHVYRKSDTQYIDNNTFSKNKSFGISVHDEGAKNLEFVGNTVEDNASDGIRLVKAPNVKLSKNQVHRNKGYALYTDSATTNPQILDNDFTGNSSGVKLGTTKGATISGNKGMTNP